MNIRRRILYINWLPCSGRILLFYGVYTIFFFYIAGEFGRLCISLQRSDRDSGRESDYLLDEMLEYDEESDQDASEHYPLENHNNNKPLDTDLGPIAVPDTPLPTQIPEDNLLRGLPQPHPIKFNISHGIQSRRVDSAEGRENLDLQVVKNKSYSESAILLPGDLYATLVKLAGNFKNMVDISSNVLNVTDEIGVQSLRNEAFSSGIFLNIEGDVASEIRRAQKGDMFHPLEGLKSTCWWSKMPGNITNMYNENVFFKRNMDNESRRNLKKNLKTFARRQKRVAAQSKLRCLPYIYVAGVTKSGTTDFCSFLKTLPNVVGPAAKETMYWNRIRLGGLINATFPDYIDMFDTLGLGISSSGNIDRISFDCTPCYLWDYHQWQSLPGNSRLSQPKYILAHTLRALTPQSRVIVLLRNPVKRTLSHWKMWYPTSPVSKFHDEVITALRKITRCVTKESLRLCVYGNNACGNPMSEAGRVCRILCASLYFVYVRDWMAVFPLNNILILKSEDYFANRGPLLTKVGTFLGEEVTSAVLDEAVEAEPLNTAVHRGRVTQDMLPETKQLLDKFYEPYNAMLAELLQEEKWRWKV